MPNLNSIDLSNNNFANLNKDVLNGINNLTTLILDSNPLEILTNSNSQYLPRMTTLIYFSCKYCQMTTFSLSPFPFPYLATIDLSHNSLTDFAPNNIASLDALTELRMNHNQFTLTNGGTQSMFKYCTQLNKLSLNNNKITAITDQLKYQTNLKYLDLSNNQITSISSTGFSYFASTLQKLGLEANGLTTLSQSFDTFNSMINVCFKGNSGIATSNSIYTKGFTVTLATCCASGDCTIA